MADDRTLTQQGGSGAQLIGGRYELWRKLGEGGMGEVFEGFDQKLHRQVALKRPPRALWGVPEARRRILEEALRHERERRPRRQWSSVARGTARLDGRRGAGGGDARCCIAAGVCVIWASR